MNDKNALFLVRANLGVVVRGPLVSLQEVLDELRKYAKSRPDLTLVFTEVSADRLFIRREGEP